MTKGLFFHAIFKFLAGVVITALLLFLSAGTIRYWNAWLLMGILFIPMLFAGIIMMFKNPELLKKRLNTKEKQKEQKTVIVFCGLMFIFGFVSAGLNFRYKLVVLPGWISVVAGVLLLCSYVLFAVVLKENTYLSRIVEVQKDQKIIDTGLYGIVRHPMYGATVILFLSMPFVLGSPVSAVIFLVYPALIQMRIRNEEKLLEKELEGYAQYKKKVKYKMIPFIW